MQGVVELRYDSAHVFEHVYFHLVGVLSLRGWFCSIAKVWQKSRAGVCVQ